MSFPRYSTYKDSGVEWPGEVPAHWEVVRLNTIATCNDEVLLESTPEDYEIEYVEISGVQAGQGIVETAALPFGNAPSRARRVVRDGDVLVSTVRTYLRAIAQVKNPPDNMIASTGFAVLRPRRINSGFLGYACHAENFVSEVIARSVGVSYPAINASELARLTLPLPTALEQTTIANFLDLETAKIDALVTEQERLIELLKEKRQAVISHVVTKGLDPSAPMKDSGLEWLGEVPAHWQVKRVKHLISLLTDYTSNGSFASLAENVKYLSEGYSRLVRLTDLRDDLTNEGVFVDEAAHRFLAKSELFGGEVLIANVGAYAGYACLMPSGQGRATLGPNMYLINFDKSVTSNDFGYLCLMSPCIQEQLRLASTSTAQPKLNKEDVKSCVTAIPPSIDEQAAILAFLAARNSEFDNLIAEVKRGITLLQERRTALISAAVTGQIDVRGLVPAETVA